MAKSYNRYEYETSPRKLEPYYAPKKKNQNTNQKAKIEKQRKKEKVYIELFANIVTNINEEIEIIYDGFGNKMFEINIENSIKKYANVISIKSENSQKEPGLQYIDNICSVLRLNISNLDKNNFYSLIKSKIKYCK